MINAQERGRRGRFWRQKEVENTCGPEEVKRPRKGLKGSERVQCVMNIDMGWLIWKERVPWKRMPKKEVKDGTVEERS